MTAQQGRNHSINVLQFYGQSGFRESTGRKVRKTLKKTKNRGGRRSLNRFNPLKSPTLQKAIRLSPEAQSGGIFGDLIADTLKLPTRNSECC